MLLANEDLDQNTSWRNARRSNCVLFKRQGQLSDYYLLWFCFNIGAVSMTFFSVFLIIVSVSLSVIAQICLKHGMSNPVVHLRDPHKISIHTISYQPV